MHPAIILTVGEEDIQLYQGIIKRHSSAELLGSSTARRHQGRQGSRYSTGDGELESGVMGPVLRKRVANDGVKFMAISCSNTL